MGSLFLPEIIPAPSKTKPYFLRTGRNHKILKMPVRPEKVEEIKAVWDSPKFKTNAQRLVHLLRHCRRIEYGYTIREFVHAIFPDKMATDPKKMAVGMNTTL